MITQDLRRPSLSSNQRVSHSATSGLRSDDPVTDQVESFGDSMSRDSSPNKTTTRLSGAGTAPTQPLTSWDTFLIRVDHLWIFEISACLFSLSCLVGIVVVLFKYNSQPPPHWSFGLNINTWVAILSTGLKSSMIYAVAQGLSQLKWSWALKDSRASDMALFDQASKGPWGALELIVRMRFKPIVKLGAMITVVALAVDPFAQALIGYRSCDRLDQTHSASIQHIRTSVPVFSNKSSDAFVKSFDPEEYSSFLSTPEVVRTIMSNILQLDAPISPGLSFRCPTSNCSFSSSGGYYQTLAITQECEEITDKLETVVLNASNPNSFHNFTYSTKTGLFSLDISKVTASYFAGIPMATIALPGGFDNSSFPLFELVAVMLNNTLRPFPDQLSPINESSEDLFADGKAVLLQLPDFANYFYHQNGSGFRPLNFPEDHMAVHCKFFSSVQTLDAVVESNKVSTTQVALQHIARDEDRGASALQNPSDTGYYYETIPSRLSTPSKVLKEGSWKDCHNASTNTSGYSVKVSTRYGASYIPSEVYYEPDCLFQLDIGTEMVLRDAFMTLFGDARLTARIDGRWIVVPNAGAVHLESLWNDGNVSFKDVDLYARRIAQSMTAVLQKRYSAASNDTVHGTTQTTLTCVHVRWGWISLPAALVLLSGVFLVLTTIQTARDSRKAMWPGLIKSSPLSLLFLAPEMDVTQEHRARLNSTVMYHAARQARMPITIRASKDE